MTLLPMAKVVVVDGPPEASGQHAGRYPVKPEGGGKALLLPARIGVGVKVI
jgi:hypothetical protein